MKKNITNEQKRRLRKRIDANLLDALESGPSTPLTAEDYQSIRREGRKRERRRTQRSR